MKKTPGKVVIFGQYKTGTTALFTKIRNSLPPATRTLFEPRNYTAEEADAERWVLSKTILKYPGHPEPVDYQGFLAFDRKLLLTREPRDWLVSATLFLIQEKASIYADERILGRIMELLKRKEQNPDSLSLKALLQYILSTPPTLSLSDFGDRTRRLHEWIFAFENRLKNAFSIKYEDFVDGRLQPMEAYLEFPLCGTADVDEPYDHVIRTRSYGNWKDWFLEEDVAFFKPWFGAYIRQYGYPLDWSLNDKQIISPEYNSEYVTRVVMKKRARIRG